MRRIMRRILRRILRVNLRVTHFHSTLLSKNVLYCVTQLQVLLYKRHSSLNSRKTEKGKTIDKNTMAKAKRRRRFDNQNVFENNNGYHFDGSRDYAERSRTLRVRSESPEASKMGNQSPTLQVALRLRSSCLCTDLGRSADNKDPRGKHFEC